MLYYVPHILFHLSKTEYKVVLTTHPPAKGITFFKTIPNFVQTFFSKRAHPFVYMGQETPSNKDPTHKKQDGDSPPCVISLTLKTETKWL